MLVAALVRCSDLFIMIQENKNYVEKKSNLEKLKITPLHSSLIGFPLFPKCLPESFSLCPVAVRERSCEFLCATHCVPVATYYIVDKL